MILLEYANTVLPRNDAGNIFGEKEFSATFERKTFLETSEHEPKTIIKTSASSRQVSWKSESIVCGSTAILCLLRLDEMVDKKMASVAGFTLCIVIFILLLILYFPEKWFYTNYDWAIETSSSSWSKFDTHQPESKVEEVSRILEDMGASLLALVAVTCVALGLAFLVCACCLC